MYQLPELGATLQIALMTARIFPVSPIADVLYDVTAWPSLVSRSRSRSRPLCYGHRSVGISASQTHWTSLSCVLSAAKHLTFDTKLLLKIATPGGSRSLLPALDTCRLSGYSLGRKLAQHSVSISKQSVKTQRECCATRAVNEASSRHSRGAILHNALAKLGEFDSNRLPASVTIMFVGQEQLLDMCNLYCGSRGTRSDSCLPIRDPQLDDHF